MLKKWKQASVERDEIKKEVEEGEEDPLQKRVEDAFKEQGVSVPLSYRAGYIAPVKDALLEKKQA